MHILDQIAAAPEKDLKPSEQFKLYRELLQLTQAQLAERMGTTQTSVFRWESDTSPISLRTMGHVRALATAEVGKEISRFFAELLPKLPLSDFNRLCGHPKALFTRDNKGRSYNGTVFIDGYRRHSLHFRIDDRRWYGLDHDSHAVKVDAAFLQSMVHAAKTR